MCLSLERRTLNCVVDSNIRIFFQKYFFESVSKFLNNFKKFLKTFAFGVQRLIQKISKTSLDQRLGASRNFFLSNLSCFLLLFYFFYCGKCEKEYFNQHLEWGAPKCWSKYTTPTVWIWWYFGALPVLILAWSLIGFSSPFVPCPPSSAISCPTQKLGFWSSCKSSKIWHMTTGRHSGQKEK